MGRGVSSGSQTGTLVRNRSQARHKVTGYKSWVKSSFVAPVESLLHLKSQDMATKNKLQTTCYCLIWDKVILTRHVRSKTFLRFAKKVLMAGRRPLNLNKVTQGCIWYLSNWDILPSARRYHVGIKTLTCHEKGTFDTIVAVVVLQPTASDEHSVFKYSNKRFSG